MHCMSFISYVSQCSTVVRNCCKGDVASQWEIAIFGQLGLWNPWTDRVEIWQDWLRPQGAVTFLYTGDANSVQKSQHLVT